MCTRGGERLEESYLRFHAEGNAREEQDQFNLIKR